ncbi:sortase B family protein [Butyrivibrio proteoclasticus B316]|uniref:Sortase B family protein n=1 Tax=Butyrivibrio proteoclasticus (strain ATCC 51982 / DSM 14932 / B316) TaxID=515622 RepID=E0S121_BUTPB|nr:class B sortase [Butyrivibrio proteoclasticus]ADL33496.1 sortase B family protein [Butyrivibrio proteoclasticus B316]
MKNDLIKEKILKIILALLGIGILVVGGAIAAIMAGYASDQKDNQHIRDLAYKKDLSGAQSGIAPKRAGSDGNLSAENSDSSRIMEETVIDFNVLNTINKDTAGWITACGENIDGPVVQTDNNDYYLEHRFDGSNGSVGCFFADANGGPAFVSPLTIIYGHNRKDGSMFHPLLEYKNPDYYHKNPEFTIDTPEGRIHYAVFSAYYGDYEDIFDDTLFDALTNNDQTSLQALFNQSLDKSILNLTPAETQALQALFSQALGTNTAQLVMLSTCEYSGSDNRMVVLGLAAY